ncbi:MAG: tetratricopeptide repeat protein [Candidatus Latescibacteria bacterium]|nr:tetratricopeptide repeat protein [Candidatus Latescibacterota bacterium]
MKKRLFIILGMLLLCISLNAQTGDTLINQALQLFETRHLNEDNTDESARILEKTLQTEPDNLTALYKLSQIYYTIADHAPTKQEKLHCFNKGIDYAQKAIRIDSGSVWAHFWYMANLGAATQLKGIFSSLASVSEVKREINLVLKLDPVNVWALNAQANVYYELPGILGGDLDKSIEILQRAIAIDPNYSILYISLANVYIKKKDYRNARFYLNQVLTLENPHPLADYVIDDKPNALKLLRQIQGK